MTNGDRRRQPSLDRARRPAIRAQAAKADVPYSVAARQLDAPSILAQRRASEGCAIYPARTDAPRQRLINVRGRRWLAERVLDTRRAADDGHAPGTRLRLLTAVPDATSLTILADPHDMIVLSGRLQR
jgi:hypothetical protein